MPRWQSALVGLVLHQPIWGAYTELFCGLSDTISVKDNGAFGKYILSFFALPR